MSDLVSDFFSRAAPVTIDLNADPPVMNIHNPHAPVALEMVIGAMIAMLANARGWTDPTDEQLDELYDLAEPQAHALLKRAIADLDAGARQSVTLVDFSHEPEGGEDEATQNDGAG